MYKNNETTRFTTTLPVSVLAELKALTKAHQIPSVNYAIREAVDVYILNIKKMQYDLLMKDAAKDSAFIERTMKCDDDFKFADSEVQSEW